MERALLRINLAQLRVDYNGDELPTDPPRKPERDNENAEDNLISATLQYPRPGTAEVTSAKAIDLPSGYGYKFDVENFWESGLFKEDVLDESIFVLTVTDRDKRSGFLRWLRRIFAAGLGGLLNPVISGITNLFLGGVAGDFSKSVIGEIKPSKKKERLTAVATTDKVFLKLQDGELVYRQGKGEWTELDDGKVELALFAPADLEHKKELQLGPGQKPKHELATVLEKGDRNGYVTLRVETHPM